MRLLSLCLAFSFLIFSQQVRAQQKPMERANVYGELSHERYKAPVIEANVLLVQVNGDKVDSTYRVSTRNGIFIYKNLKPGKVYIKVSKMGLETVDGVFDLVGGDNAVLFTMRNSAETIKEATVTASASLMRMLGDTTVFNAAAVKTMEGDKAIALLEQLPGFDLSGGSLKYRGKKIARTYVNGVQVFGDNARTAFDMLLADEVTHVKVYEEAAAEDKRRGLKNSEKDQVLDVTTKESILSLGSVSMQVSGGADEARNENGNIQGRYYARGTANFYSEMRQASVFLGVDNVAQPVEGMVDGGMPSAVASFGPLSSYKENIAAQMEFTHRWKDRKYGNALTGNYAFSHVYSRSVERVLTDYFETDASPARNMSDTTLTGSKRRRHDFGVGLFFQDTPLKSIDFSLDGTLTEADSWTKASSLVISPDGNISQNSGLGSNADDLNLNGHLVWKNNDLGQVRPRVILNGSFKNANSLSWNVDTLSTSYIRRNLQSDGIGKSWNARLRSDVDIILTNKSARTSKLTLGASAKTERMKRRNITMDILDPESPVQDLANTYDYTWNTISAGFDQTFSNNKGGNRFEVSLKESVISQRDDERLPADARFRHSYLDISSEISYRRKFGMFSISGQSMIPSLEQTRNRITDTNPLVLAGGNPNLRQQYMVNAVAYDNIFMDKKTGLNLGYNLGASCTFDPIVMRTYYFTQDTALPEYDGYVARKGALLNTFVNASDPVLSVDGLVSLSHRSKKVKLSSSLKLGGGYDSRPQYLRDELAHVGTFRAKADLSEMFTVSKRLSMSGGLKLTYLHSSSDAYGLLSSSLVTSANGSVRYQFGKPAFINVSASVQNNDYLSGAGTDNLFADVKLEIGHRFTKQGFIVSLCAYDLLNRASAYTTRTTADYYMQKWNSSYGRYFLLNVRYELRKKNAFRR